MPKKCAVGCHSVLHCVTVCCSVLQCVDRLPRAQSYIISLCCSVLYCVDIHPVGQFYIITLLFWSVLQQYVAVCHSVLQCVTLPLQAQSGMAVGGKLTFYFSGKFVICS